MRRVLLSIAIVAVAMSLAGAPGVAWAASPSAAFTPDSRVAAMINEVNKSNLTAFVAVLSGETTATIGGSPYRITTRATYSGTPIAKATQYLHEYMESRGLAASYHNWSAEGRNVVGTKPGTSRADEILLVIAHLDDLPTTGTAPGADDDASGVSAVMSAAAICATREFQRTIRFVLFTGNEQGLLGCDAYAMEAYERGDNIVAVLNMDMIGYNTGRQIFEMHTRKPAMDGYAADLAIATVMTKVVQSYGLSSSIIPSLRSANEYYTSVDSFRKYAWPGVLVIEQNIDFNPYYHTPEDRLAHIDPSYLQNVTKVVVGTLGHLAMLPPPKNAAGRNTYLYR